jgi:hypothetical protein
VTERERQIARRLIDQARRRTVTNTCGYCGEPFPPHPNGQTKRYCTETHRKKAWLQTPQGRAWNRAKRVRERAAA